MPTPPTDAAFDDEQAKQVFVVKDERAAIKMRKAEAAEARHRYAAIVAREKLAAKAAREVRREEMRLEVTKLKLSQDASQKARTVIAQASPWMVCFICGGFVLALSTGKIPDEATATSSALITLVMTGLLANLRSIISEGNSLDQPDTNGNGHDSKPPPPKPTPPTKK